MKLIGNMLRRWPEYQTLAAAVKQGALPAAVAGLSGIHKCCVLASLCQETGRKALVLAADEAEAQRFSEDLFALGMRPALYPIRDFQLPGHGRRLPRIRAPAAGGFVPSCRTAAATWSSPVWTRRCSTPSGPQELAARMFQVEAGQELKIEELLAALVRCGYVREDQIEAPGQFSHRGGIVDFFSPGGQSPVRVEFWGDEVDSVSYFDLDSQRRTDPVDAVTLAPCVEVIPADVEKLAQKIEKLTASLRGKRAPKAKEVLLAEAEKLRHHLRIGSLDKFITLAYPTVATLFDYFDPQDSLVVFSEGNRLKERVRTTQVQWAEDLKAYLEEGVLCKGLDQYSEDWEYALSKARRCPPSSWTYLPGGSYEVPTRTW